MTSTRPFAARTALAALLAGSLGLAACSGSSDPSADASSGAASEAVVPSSQSLPDALDDADGVQTVAEAIKKTGLTGIFAGNASYTLLAPEDEAFTALGDAGKTLVDGDDNAALAALLKDHMLPGYVTPDDIATAIAGSSSGQVVMPTLSGEELTFSKNDDGTIAVSAADGSQATLDGEAIAGQSSVAIAPARRAGSISARPPACPRACHIVIFLQTAIRPNSLTFDAVEGDAGCSTASPCSTPCAACLDADFLAPK